MCQHGKVARVELPLKPAGWASLWVTPPAKPSEPQNHPNRPKTCRKNPRMLKNTGRELRGVSQPRYSQSVYCWSWANSAGLSEIQPPSLIVGHSGAAPRPPTTTPGAAQAHISITVGSGPVGSRSKGFRAAAAGAPPVLQPPPWGGKEREAGVSSAVPTALVFPPGSSSPSWGRNSHSYGHRGW